MTRPAACTAQRTPAPRTGRRADDQEHRPTAIDGKAVRMVPIHLSDHPTEPVPQTGARDFDEFYAAHFRSTTVQIFASFGDMAEAQDIAQEAFCRALARWETIAGYDDPVAWVRVVAWNLATSRWRRVRTALTFARKQRAELVPPPSPDHVALTAALRTLPEKQRRAVVLFYLADLSVAEVALDAGVPTGTVKSWLSRAREALARELSDGSSGKEESHV